MPYGEVDAIVVPGGSLDAEGNLAARNLHRLDLAIRLFHQGVAPRMIMTGGRQLFAEESLASEAELMKDYAVLNQVPENAVYTEANSRDTIGNATQVKRNILLPNDWQNILIVTSDSHERRCRKIFARVLGNQFEVASVAAPEKLANVKRATTVWGVLTMRHILNGIESGDHETVEHRLKERVPGYGGPATLLQLRIHSVMDFLLHPLSTP